MFKLTGSRNCVSGYSKLLLSIDIYLFVGHCNVYNEVQRVSLRISNWKTNGGRYIALYCILCVIFFFVLKFLCI